MIRHLHFIVILSCVLFSWACSTDKNSTTSFSISEKLSGNEQAEFELKVSQHIKEYANANYEDTIVSLGITKIFVSHELTKLYKEGDYMRLWSDEKNRTDLVHIIEEAYYDGLNPNDYHIEPIKQLIIDKKENLEEESSRLAKLDILMSDAIMLYAFHMIQGKVHPESLDPKWNYSRRDIPDDIELKLMARLNEGSLVDSIKNLSPQIPMYNRYRKWFIHYDSLKDRDIVIKQLEFPGEPLELGDSSSLVAELKNHLANFDVSGISNYDGYFDEELQTTLTAFQEHFGIAADGVAGKSTFDALNTSIKDRIDMIRVNMERCRWINNLPPEEFLLVNIADYNLYIFSKGIIDYSSRVVVGKEYHKTPVFTSDIKYVVFNPTWTIPYSIATKETLPRLKRDPQYLQNRNMTLLRNGREIDPETIDFSAYSTSNFPFTIRQEPGDFNALGRVKFIFPNKYSVYLHDTPSKSYFNRTQRTFSHGCVRVHNPLNLAEQLLGD
ncbi:MAG: L,D-transpeptidase family protein, partial [Cyclobacteriaceae bacterium]|nr:L,D-transpeptidase family protein [Cyclobacteriaceae bacterium]